MRLGARYIYIYMHGRDVLTHHLQIVLCKGMAHLRAVQELGAVACALCAGKNVLEGAWQDADVKTQDDAKLSARQLQQQDNGGTLRESLTRQQVLSAYQLATYTPACLGPAPSLKVLNELAAKHSTKPCCKA